MTCTRAARELYARMKAAGLRVKLDERDLRPGNKFADWEMRGVPLRIELGAKDLAAAAVTFVRRDKEKGEAGAKFAVPLDEAVQRISPLLDRDARRTCSQKRRRSCEAHTHRATGRDEFMRLCEQRAGMIDIPWCGLTQCEAAVKAATSATTRNLRPLESGDTACVACGEPAHVRAYFAQSY